MLYVQMNSMDNFDKQLIFLKTRRNPDVFLNHIFKNMKPYVIYNDKSIIYYVIDNIIYFEYFTHYSIFNYSYKYIYEIMLLEFNYNTLKITNKLITFIEKYLKYNILTLNYFDDYPKMSIRNRIIPLNYTNS